MKKFQLQNAITFAKTKLENHPEKEHFPHYSFIYQRGQLLGWATNGNLEPPRHFGYHNHPSSTFRPKYHSELWVYKKVRGILVEDSFEIVNIRLNKKGEVKLSNPCKTCYHIMSVLGCKTFYCSSGINNLFMTIKGQI